MTAYAFDGLPAEAVLINKKQFGQVLADKARLASAWDTIRSAPARIGRWLATKAGQLHMGWVGERLGNATSWLTGWAKRLGGMAMSVVRRLGWKTIALHLVVNKRSRDAALGALGKVYTAVKRPLVWLTKMLAKVPLVGALVAGAITSVAVPVEHAAAFVIGYARTWLDDKDDLLLFLLVSVVTSSMLVSRSIGFLPANVQVFARISLVLTMMYRVYVEIQDDSAVEEVRLHLKGARERVSDVTKSTVHKVADTAAARVMDGPGHPARNPRQDSAPAVAEDATTLAQPGTVEAKIMVIDTQEVINVSLDVDSRGQEWLTWEGTTYDWHDLPEDKIKQVVGLAEQPVAETTAKAAATASGSGPVPGGRDAARYFGASKKTQPNQRSTAKASPRGQ